MKIRFNSDNDLPLNKPLKFHAMTMIIRSVFKKDDKLYPKLFFRWHFVRVCVKMLQYEKIELMSIKDICQKNVSFVIIDTLKILDLNLKSMSVMDVMIY